MPEIMTKEAKEIAAKLSNNQPLRAGRKKLLVTQEEGAKHFRVKIWYGDVLIGSFGIQRGSRQQSHSYIPEQIHVTNKQAMGLAKCPFSVDDFIDALIMRGEVPEDEEPAA